MLFSLEKYFKNKKGMSSVVIALILVLLSLVAIGVVWVAIMNIIGDSVKQINLSGLMIKLEIKNVEINGDISVTVQRKVGEGDLSGIVFLFSDGSKEESLREDANLDVYGIKTFTFNLQEIKNVSSVKEVSIAPIVGDNQVGEILDTYIVGVSNFQSSSSSSNDEEEILEETFTCETTGCQGNWICQYGECVAPALPPECSLASDCPNFYDCINASCSCIATCQNLNYNCGTQVICGVEVDCGTCSSEQYCSSAQCLQDNIINSGTVGEVFPSQAKLYFSSETLPTRLSLPLFGKYVEFPALGECRQITYHGLIPVYNINYVEFDEAVANLETGTSYNIWNKTICGAPV